MRVLVLVALGLLPAIAHADDGMRCGEWLVGAGAGQYEVSAKCGAPTAATARPVCRRGHSVDQDIWVYDRGPNEFVRTLFFEGGVLQGVDVGNWGHK